MNRHTFALGLGIGLAFAAVPAAAQTVLVDVGVHAGPVSGRVVYGAPAVYADHGVHVVGHHDHGWRDGRRHAKHERKRRKAERRYYRHLHRLEHQHARAHRHCRH